MDTEEDIMDDDFADIPTISDQEIYERVLEFSNDWISTDEVGPLRLGAALFAASLKLVEETENADPTELRVDFAEWVGEAAQKWSMRAMH